MNTLFTKYLFVLFLLPIIVLFFAFFMIDPERGEIGEYGVNREIVFGNFAFLANSLYNSSVFLFTYAIFFSIYLIFPLIRRRTDFNWSVIHFMSFVINFVLLSINSTNKFIIPLCVISIYFFVMNSIKSKKSGNSTEA